MAVLAAALGVGAPRAESGGIPLGPFEFYPSLTVEAGDDSNIFNQVDDPPAIVPIADQFALLRAPLVWRLPFRQSAWDLLYTPGWNAYQENKGLQGTTQEFGTRLLLAFSSGAELEVVGGRLDDYLNTTAFDPGGEVSFGDSDYTLDGGTITYDHPLSPRHAFRIRSEYEDLNFEEDAGASFVSYRDLRLQLSYLNSLGASTTLFVDLVGGAQDQDRTTIEIDEDRWTRSAIQVGLERRFERSDSARIFLAYEDLNFANTDDSEFSGLVGQAIYSRLLAGGLRFKGDVLRAVSPSVFNINNFYVTNRLAVELEWRPGGRLFYRLRAAASQNGYPEEAEQFCRSAADPSLGIPFDPVAPCATNSDGDPLLLYPPEIIGVARQDRQFRGRAGVGFQFSRTAAVELAYDYTTRDSNMDPFDFTTRRLSLEFRFGWRPDRELI